MLGVMSADAQTILSQLQVVAREREARTADAALGAAVQALKSYQQQRFARTYADLLANPRYAAAARFFLDELYGPKDYSERDAQFARVVPALVRLFPHDLVGTVELLARLHALSETLDSTMGRHLLGQPIDRSSYATAWQRTGQSEARDEQIRLTLAVGRDLDRLTRKPLLRTSLHLMRGPARAAGLPALQQFLESGFDTFKAMGGADPFLATVEERENALAAALFEWPVGAAPLPAALGQLP
ncbi:FFLEELY motif protein [Piscinibacter sp.]|uniref:FFLEELY motif protein n=1 Tax=Piscinibacter sp. TaxID=1903157 RepID=UPI0039E28B15